MAAPSEDWLTQIWNAVWPGVSVIGGGIATLLGKVFWSSFFSARSDEARELRQDEKDRRQVVRNLDTRASVELERAWKRIDQLEKENDDLRSEVRLWEARARRVDVVAHDLRDGWTMERRALSIVGGTPIPSIPLLEDLLK